MGKNQSLLQGLKSRFRSAMEMLPFTKAKEFVGSQYPTISLFTFKYGKYL